MFVVIALLARKTRTGASNWLLSAIADYSGYADITQFQILPWTTVIGSNAIFAMLLSGTTVDISSTELRAQRWSDLISVRGDLRDLDLARIQILILSTPCALFITTKVILAYGRPDVPNGILPILGISNGIYVAGPWLPGAKQARI
jgi:hypothetical protein